MAIVDKIFNEIKLMVARFLLGKKYSEYEEKDLVYNTEEEVILITLKRLVFQGNVNEAEEILFDKAKTVNSENMQYIAIEFYTMLMEKTDEELESMNFSKQEVYQGIEDIRKVLNLE
ncbi:MULTISPECIES: DUF6483 family protein [unclassified Clostridioides]|uniref:DUF6483 family protein n=1 Tax=unclassified Clostridioides TaxID=2635829 RepID=UPI001D0F7984|nr:hypothetical protein [Clostridioides sp. ZZV14-6150]MCC0662107.1 hypothetical protein [Clostridioides sp. ZZV14-6154]MCC0669896.1 hypothetical protein [Clostridioides sp. ZZV14-6153]MCC0719798.1 hypothetical protein [Clostridioides sp. ZZV14-6105]MCC0722132.1 hypothetical protein [Clostridioides sp. ZZV14-6104]MCC0728221.1 hypothetical protein [Clostridioides sp. ZZV14-6045]MCC0736342.1 hypothetical protein [Clostridioides sp. ZZV14-6009]MCC0740070.1 hypothetical protein [Clostridioides s